MYYGAPNMAVKPSMSDRYYKWKGSWKVRGGGVIECIFKDTLTYSRVTGNTKDETPVYNMTKERKGIDVTAVHIYIYIYTHTHTHRERERERETADMNYNLQCHQK